MKADFRRGKSKFMYTFLPWNTFNHPKAAFLGRIKKLYNDTDPITGQDIELDVKKDFIIRRVMPHIKQWPNGDALDIKYARTEIVVPAVAQYDVCPRVFECPSCRSWSRFTEEEVQNWSDGDPICCENCSVPLRDSNQTNFIAICECGTMRELWIPECQSCDSDMGLNRDSTQMYDFYWRCVNGCGTQLPWVAYNIGCPRNRCDNEDVKVLNHTSSEVFYPQSVNFVNVQGELSAVNDARQQRDIVANYLIGGSRGKALSSSEKAKRALELMQQSSNDYADTDKAIEQVEENERIDIVEERDKAEQWLQDEFDSRFVAQGNDADQSEQRIRLCEELRTYLTVHRHREFLPKGGIESRSFTKLRNESDEYFDTHLSNAKLDEYINIKDDLNFEEVRLIRDFPLLTVTYGYTRTKPNPPGKGNSPFEVDMEDGLENRSGDDNDDDSTPSVELNLFNTGRSSRQQFFGQESDAEAVYIKLSPEKVIQWLKQVGVVSDSYAPDPSNERETKEWFMENVIPPGKYESIPEEAIEDDPVSISRHCYTLLHSISHLNINTMGMMAGHQKESLIERLLPRSMSFVIYKRPDTDFQLGSIFTLFEERFKPFSKSLVNEMSECSIDPVCTHNENGACEDCMFLAFQTCENANYNLSRATVFGGPFDDHLPLGGYFDV